MVSSEPSLWTKNSSAFCFNRFGAVSILKFQQQKSPPQQPQPQKADPPTDAVQKRIILRYIRLHPDGSDRLRDICQHRI